MDLTQPHNRRRVLKALAASVAAFSTGIRADNFPSKPIRLVVPFPAGGPTDIVKQSGAKVD